MSAPEKSAPTEDAGASSAAPVKLGFLVGPTGAGKSAIALAIAERLDAEIVNADSRQLYRGMDIGTAKPSAEERRRIPHHLIDVCGPDEPIDVASFVSMARAAIRDIARRGRRPLVVGGSGLYLRVLRGGIFSGPSASPEIRRELEDVARERGASFLHDQLGAIDPVSAARIQRNDLYRIVRALEVYRLTGVPISVHQERHRFSAREFDSLTVGVDVPRAMLYAAIDRRFDAMVAAGFAGEVRALLAAGYNPERPPLSTIGYKEIAAFVRGETTLEAAVEQAKRETRHLAKRQLTWFRREPGIVWVDADRAAEQALLLFEEFFSSPHRAVQG
ncbi:MAG TPA: tRNA (adenosine(37)-N6)-dimethylallyltransferase MiaA [Candidatus Binataceae bacterium]|nr:tRNA (adenosine(37)-N6)-dimethylallyltransferase MiaA [Candidatus Binataceae bacterium]